jgi:hypothetical protein
MRGADGLVRRSCGPFGVSMGRVASVVISVTIALCAAYQGAQ